MEEDSTRILSLGFVKYPEGVDVDVTTSEEEDSDHEDADVPDDDVVCCLVCWKHTDVRKKNQ